MKPYGFMLAAVAIAALFLVGCGSGGSGTNPPPQTYIIGGTVSGLSGTGLVLQNNGGNNLSISGNGSFTFSTAIAAGGAYSVAVLTQPSNPVQTCTVANGSGTANANVTNVQVSCAVTYTIGGTVSALSGTGLVLENNGGDNLAISVIASYPFPFTFSAAVTAGSTYNVTVLTQPSNPAQKCTVVNGSGTANANVTSVQVGCASPFTLFSFDGTDGGNPAMPLCRARTAIYTERRSLAERIQGVRTVVAHSSESLRAATRQRSTTFAPKPTALTAQAHLASWCWGLTATFTA